MTNPVDNQCEIEPNHAHSIWKCHWSSNQTLRICKKSCLHPYKLSTDVNNITCSINNGWENKIIAECVQNDLTEKKNSYKKMEKKSQVTTNPSDEYEFNAGKNGE